MLKRTDQLKIKISLLKLDASNKHKKLKSEKQKGITSSNNNKKPKSASKSTPIFIHFLLLCLLRLFPFSRPAFVLRSYDEV
ncbi:hypothetical protein Pst134EA_011574 [Puccinia striiformis f. sp. tritici]|uniref:hypothetical protein n=1 Tax=Puccinia striiformis f. sp. tritici TaxID=168172 RepID=UPI002007725B|nr:hypothetical protein Pst134EA_011574 [Puccinia striiformis f. sp. tritici]KAH9467954.1 hypothetical protein Pst134EA_011574 [Puccinia striiformis f. sp. tritici]